MAERTYEGGKPVVVVPESERVKDRERRREKERDACGVRDAESDRANGTQGIGRE